MRNALLILTFITITAIRCPPMHYRAKNIYKENKSDGNKIILNNGLALNFRFSSLDWSRQDVGVAIFCDLHNPTQYVQVLNRKNFSVVSSQGIKFKIVPMEIADESNLLFKIYTLPEEYPVAPQQKTDYVFIFYSFNKFSEQQAIEFIKKDTFFFFCLTMHLLTPYLK
jgi:hypothetical protein